MTLFSRSVELSLRTAAMFVASMSLVACTTMKLPAPSGSPETAETLRAANLSPAKTDKFKVAPNKAPELDTSLGGLRGSSIEPPDGSFSKYLQDQIVAELRAAGLYDPNAAVVIGGQLTDSKVDAAIGTGTASLAARFTVTRAGVNVYDKEIAVTDQWESSFVGAVAIPAAMNHYTALYKALAKKLFNDPAFKTALKR
jgi:hypothetical protein